MAKMEVWPRELTAKEMKQWQEGKLRYIQMGYIGNTKTPRLVAPKFVDESEIYTKISTDKQA